MGTLKTTNIQTITGSGTLTLGTSGETITVPTGVTVGGLMANTPSFAAYNNVEQTGVANSTHTKVQYNTEILDSDNCYDNSTNYRFTPTTAGKYFVYHRIGYGRSASNAFNSGIVSIYKNGSSIAYNQISENASSNYFKQDVSTIVDMNGTTDYLEAYALTNVGSGTRSFYAGIIENMFMAYKIIGS